MASRPVFVPVDRPELVDVIDVEFTWNPGFAPDQKRRNVAALHRAARNRSLTDLLEVSTKSDQDLGIRLSAFNLSIELSDGATTSVEAAYQGSKVFEEGGPFGDLRDSTAAEAKRDQRLRSSGALIEFRLDDYRFPAQPTTAFYDWLYARALTQRRKWLDGILRYKGFTDIEFNPKKSLNCQARACAVAVTLEKQDRLQQATATPESWLEVVYPSRVREQNDGQQEKLF